MYLVQTQTHIGAGWIDGRDSLAGKKSAKKKKARKFSTLGENRKAVQMKDTDSMKDATRRLWAPAK